jgi:transglutaminase-like putative cysteine protease
MTTDTRAPSTAAAPRAGGVWLPALIVFVAMLLTAVSLTAVFSDTAWFVEVMVMVTLVLVTGALFRSIPALRASGMTVAAQLVVAVLAAVYLCVPHTLAGGVLPTGASLVELFAQLATGIDDIYRTTAPAPSTPGFRAILTAGFGLITMLIDGLVTDIRAPKVAGILLLLVYIVPVLLAPQQLAWWHFAAIAAAFLLLMLSSYIESAHLRSPATAVLAGALALVIGVGLPVLLPDVAMRPDRAQNPQGDLTVVNPFLDLKSDLTSDNDALAFTYTSDDPLAPPIRLTSVSEFDGTTWMPTEFDIDPFAVAVEGLPTPQGVTGDTRTVERTAEFDIAELDQQHLPAPYAPQAADGLSRRWIYDPETLTIVGNGEITSGAQYSIDYLSVEPSVDALRSAQPVSATEFEDYLRLPDDSPDLIAQTADEVTAGAATEWDKATALQSYFRSGEFEYSLDAPPEASGSALADFLLEKRGYCVQFAGAMTAMARTLGIPARIGVGFAAGTPTGDNSYEVRINQAHAWPELYFEGAGWVRFEPTPGGPAGDPPPWTDAEAAQSEETTSPTPTEESPTAGSEESGADTEAGTESEEAAEPQSSTGIAWTWVGVIALVVLVLLALPALLRRGARARRLREPLDPEAVWAEFGALALDHGDGLAPATTVREHVENLSRIAPQARSGLEQVGRAVDESRYAGSVRTALDRGEVQTALQEVQRGLAGQVGRRRAVLARLWPVSVFGRR